MIPDRLRELRTRKKLSQEGLADLIGVRGQQVWRYEKGTQTPTAEIITKLAAVLGTSADYLLGISDDPSPGVINRDLSEQEQNVINAWRRGDYLSAIRGIVEDSKAKV